MRQCIIFKRSSDEAGQPKFHGGGKSAKVSQHGMFLPKYFFITSGKAVSAESSLNAFDEALMNAKIDQCNIVSVSSIIPPDAIQIDPVLITSGTITFAVLVRMDGSDGETIGAGVAWAWGRTTTGLRYGIVAEDHGHKDNLAIDRELKDRLQRMSKARRLQLEEIHTRIEHIDTIPNSKFGCVISAFVYVPWQLQDSVREAIAPTMPRPAPSSNGTQKQPSQTPPTGSNVRSATVDRSHLN